MRISAIACSALLAGGRLHAVHGQINYASAGNGSTHHFCGELLKSLAGINIVHVPYKGSTPALSALVGGEVSMMFSNVADTQPLIKSEIARMTKIAASAGIKAD